MARGRMISKSLSTSEKFAALVSTAGDLAEFCQTLYLLLVPHTDDFGRLQGDPFTVKHVCHPSSPRTLADFSSGLAHLHTVQLITWYAVSRKKYIQIGNFDPHQLGLHKRTRSAFPRVPGNSGNEAEVPAQEKGTKGKGTKGKYPLPPTRGSRARRGRRDGVKGAVCPHDPRCHTTKSCIDRTLADARAVKTETAR
jgi:hypothetical protein